MKMNKKISLGMAISLIAIAVAITCILTMAFSQNLFNSMLSTASTRTELNEIESYVKNNYLYSVDEDTSTAALSSAYLKALGDQYAEYYSAEEYALKQKADAGYVVGVGLDVAEDVSGYMLVTSVLEKSPAADVKITEGDMIVAVNGEDIHKKGYAECAKLLSNDEGMMVTVTVRRNGVNSEYQLSQRRMEITTVTGRLIGSVGYVKIDSFNLATTDQFIILVDKLIHEGAKSFVFDVRNNAGGSVEAVEEVLNYILDEGELVKATYKDGSVETVVKTDSTTKIELPMAVLVNEQTASSAEIFAACLRDFGGASLVGTTTFGKGVIQQTQPLSTGAAIKITVATYETAKTPCFDGVGIKPNFEVSLSKDEQENFANLDETTDPQLRKAISVVDVGGTSIPEETTTPEETTVPDETTEGDETTSETEETPAETTTAEE